MYRRILVPLDGSELAEQALPYVHSIGKGLGARIELLRVAYPVAPEALDPALGPYQDQIAAYLEGIAAPLTEDGLAVASTIREGDPAPIIVSEAEKEPDTLIAISTHGRSGITRWLLGSITDKVLHATTNPLLIMRAREPVGAQQATPLLDTIIVPLDGSDLAEQVLPHATALAQALHLKVLLVRVTPPAEAYYRYMHYPVDPYQDPVHQAERPFVPYQNVPIEVDAEAVGYLGQVSRKLSPQGLTSVVAERLLHGDPAGAIVDLAQQTPNNLVAMTTHGRSGVGRWVLGSVTDRVVRHSGDPVLVIRAVAESQ